MGMSRWQKKGRRGIFHFTRCFTEKCFCDKMEQSNDEEERYGTIKEAGVCLCNCGVV